MEYKFYKSETGQWYIDLPEYIEAGIGTLANLEMVEGADKMLELLAVGEEEVILEVTIGLEKDFHPHDDGHYLVKLETHEGELSGATYRGNFREVIGNNLLANLFNVWLCDVTKYVFGDFPEIIYVRRINK